MKTSLFLLLALLSLNVTAFSQHINEPVRDKAFKQAEALIEDDMKNNIPEIQRISQQLTYDQKKTLITEHKKDYTVPLLINVLTPYAIGSFYQGDILGGVIGLAGDLTGQAILIGAYIDFYLNTMDNMDSYDREENDYFKKYLTYIVVGGAISTASLIFKIIKPITYAGSYNKILKKAVPQDREYTLQMIPDLKLTSDGEITPAVNFKVSY